MKKLITKSFRHKGSIRFERFAARIYDKRQILANGLNAKTNFDYTKGELEKMLVNEDDLIEYELLKQEELQEI